MAQTKFYVQLTDSERSLLTNMICEGTESKRTIMRAKILLMSESAQRNKVSIRELANRLQTTETTIKTVRTEYATLGLEAALYRKKRSSTKYRTKINENVIKEVLTLAGSNPPPGCKRWSSRMICEALITQGVIDHIGPTAVCKILKSNGA